MHKKVMFWTCFLIYVSCFYSDVASYKIKPKNFNTENEENGYKIVCYHSYPGTPFNGSLSDSINVKLCTHIIMFACGIVDSRVYINPMTAKNYLTEIPLMKKINPKIKVLCCNGGNFTQVLATETNRSIFARSAVPLLRKYGFDGLDLDWEFPAYQPYWHLSRQKQNFSLSLKALRSEFEKEAGLSSKPRLLLTAAVSANGLIMMRSYEVPQLSKYLDFINLMTYDIHFYMAEFPFTGYNSPLFPADNFLDETIFKVFNLAWAANEWAKRGMKKTQIIVGVAFYGHTFTLDNPASHGLYALAKGIGPADEVGYSYICGVVNDSSSHVMWDNSSVVPYVYRDALWISYDNTRSISNKVKWTIKNKFGGTMIFSLNNDDYAGSCEGKTKWPLLKAVNNTIHTFLSFN